MGKGDKRTTKGKIKAASYGKSRSHKTKVTFDPQKKTVAVAKETPVKEVKKTVKKVEAKKEEAAAKETVKE